MQTIICMKWGDRYGADYVNRLYGAIQRQTMRPTRLVCFTDDTKDIIPEVQTEPMPPITLPKAISNYPWRKLTAWMHPLADLSGDVLFLDLDLVITGNLDEMFDYESGRFCVIENWTQAGQGIGNTSAFRFPVGKYSYIYNDFQHNPDDILARYNIEQVYISKEIDDMIFWPKNWCVSFKHSLLPKWPLNFFKTPKLGQDTKIVAFTGKPDQDEAALGQWPVKHWIKRIYKFVKPTPWIKEHWQ